MDKVNQDCFIVSGNKSIFSFNLDVKNNLNYKIYDKEFQLTDENTIGESNVSMYSIALDDKDCINILYLASSGELHLLYYDHKEWADFIIGKFNLTVNKYYQLDLMYINEKINIIYAYSNYINLNICTIQHIIYKDNIEQSHKIIEYASVNKKPEFSVDYDKSGTIHLLYNTITNTKSYIYHCFYSPYRRSWSNNPKALWEGIETGHSYIFVDSMNSIHSIWLEKSFEKYKLSYNKMDTTGRNKYIWTDINLNNLVLSENNLFTLYEKDKNIYYSYSEGQNIKILESNNYGKSWTIDSKTKCNNISRIKIIISNDLHYHSKVNHILSNLKDINNSQFIKALFQYVNINNDEQKAINKEDNEEFNMESNYLGQEDKDSIEQLIKDLISGNQSSLEESTPSHIAPKEIIGELNQEISEMKIQIRKILSNQTNLLEKYEEILKLGDINENEILQIKDEFKQLKIPLIKRIFG